MRKLLISILLASAASTAAVAAPDDRSDRQQTRAERQEAREQARADRAAERAESAGRPERMVGSSQTVDAPARVHATGRADARDVDALRAARDARRESLGTARDERLEQRQERLRDLREARDLRQSTRPLPNVLRTRTPVVSPVPREGTQPPPPIATRTIPQPQWSTHWRHNSKYDWYNWRKRHRSLFHFGFYYDPFGWGYSPYQIGWRMWPSYYSSSFWLNDPWRYRLPYAPPGTRWIRYYDDAVLVDMWSGQVLDVIYNFFW
jgi:hypothetical protein